MVPTSRKGSRQHGDQGSHCLPARLPPHLDRDPFRIPHDPQRIQARHLLHISFGPAAPQQLGDQIWKLGHILQTDRHFRDAIEVGTYSHAIDAGDPADVLDVIGDLG